MLIKYAQHRSGNALARALVVQNGKHVWVGAQQHQVALLLGQATR